MPLRNSKAKVLEQLILLLYLEINNEAPSIVGDNVELHSDDFEYELKVKRKRKFQLIKDEED